jgi:hypothetical protein
MTEIYLTIYQVAGNIWNASFLIWPFNFMQFGMYLASLPGYN